MSAMEGRVRKRLWSAGSILCYHAIDTPTTPSRSPVNVPLEHFARELDLVQSRTEIVPLSYMVERYLAGQSVAGLAAITFDDGYASILEALPVLESKDIPITVFVTCEAAENGAAFWWDRMEDLYPHVPLQRWRAFEDELGLPESYRARQPVHEGPLHPLRQWILAQHRGRWPRPLEPVLASLEQETGFRTAQRCMTLQELDSLAAHSQVSLGVHTWSHPVLPSLEDAELREEIRSCRHWLQQRYPTALPYLAFPFGLFDRRSTAAANEEGMLATFSLNEQSMRRGVVDGVLPRISGNRNLSNWKLGVRMTGWLDRWVGRRHGLHGPYPTLPST